MIDRSRKRGRTPTSQSLSDGEELAGPGEKDNLELGDEVARVSGALQELRPHQREVLELSLVHGRSHQQIADTTGLALGTVKSRVRLAFDVPVGTQPREIVLRESASSAGVVVVLG